MNASRDPLLAYLRLLAGDRPAGHYFDIRWSPGSRGAGMERSFVPALRTHLAASLIERHAPERDVYVGAALRTTDGFGGKQAIAGSHLAYIECDTRSAAEALTDFPHPPTMAIASGTPGHLHAYWHLDHCESNEAIERANRRLAAHLGGDLASVDIARILRPPGTLNHKHHPPRPVGLLAHRPGGRHTLERLTAGLADPEPARARPAVRVVAPRDQLDARLRTIAAPEYALALAGARADRAGKIACPFHDDSNPSLQLYEGGTFYCFGCRRGGSIYDFAAALWHLQPRGPGFMALRRRLAERFHFEPPSAAC
jgi:hypothetical protein